MQDLAQMSPFLLLIFGFVLSHTAGQSCSDTSTIDNIASNLQVKFAVVSNLVYPATASLTLTNIGTTSTIEYGTWEIYFSSLRNISFSASVDSLKVLHINGVLYKMYPTTKFPVLSPAKSINLPMNFNSASVSRTDTMPNWYVVEQGCSEGRTLSSTAGFDLDWVSPFTTVEQWKRSSADQYNPYTPQDRYNINYARDDGPTASRWTILPTPVIVTMDTSQTVDVIHDGWVIVAPDSALTSEANFLSAALNLNVVLPEDAPGSQTIELSVGSINNPVNSTEAYTLSVDAVSEKINLMGNSPTGVFYAVQTLISLSFPDGLVPNVTVIDYPRFPYRGHMIDVARNFHNGVDDIKTLIDGLATYKLNRLHLHLGDDEGWRLEIPGLPELTQVGGRRCHDLSETQCVISQLGSGPTDSTSGTGWYSVAEYRDILSYANERHITVIPEFDMPGHSHAAIVSMLARYKATGDTQFLLTDLNDTSKYMSVQGFTDNAVDPCIDSTYDFIHHVVSELIEIHRGIQNLTLCHLGGDEVAPGAWINSPSCIHKNMTTGQLKLLFIERIAQITAEFGLDLVAWEDGFYDEGVLIERDLLPNTDVYSTVWDNVWEWGTGGRAYTLANDGYKVILSHATDLYFDMPQEPDPEERGLYWASRTISMKKVFRYQPDNVYANIDFDRNGNPQNATEICQAFGCPELTRPDNIVGMQSQLWSETVRQASEYQSNVFPRMLALAERSWHKSDWELDQSESSLDEDWTSFANRLGYYELQRLDNLGINYRVPPPGASVDDTLQLEAISETPGLRIQYSLDGVTWTDLAGKLQLETGDTVTLATLSADGTRHSRQVQVSV